MTGPATRSPFTLHLSTALVLLFIFGGLLGLQFQARDCGYRSAFKKCYGFPLTCYENHLARLDFAGLALNVLFIFVVVGSAYFISESRIRRENLAYTVRNVSRVIMLGFLGLLLVIIVSVLT